MENPVEFVFQFWERAMRCSGEPENAWIALEVLKSIDLILRPAQKLECFGGQAQSGGKSRGKHHGTERRAEMDPLFSERFGSGDGERKTLLTR